jgi:hypothetical protein
MDFGVGGSAERHQLCNLDSRGVKVRLGFQRNHFVGRRSECQQVNLWPWNRVFADSAFFFLRQVDFERTADPIPVCFQKGRDDAFKVVHWYVKRSNFSAYLTGVIQETDLRLDAAAK